METVQKALAFHLAIALLGLGTRCGAQEIFNARGFHRNIPQYAEEHVWLTDKSSNRAYLDLREQLRLARKKGNDKAVATLLSEIGCCLDFENSFYKAERFHSEALEIARRIYPDDSPLLADAYHNVAVNREFQKRYEDAITSYGKAADIRQKTTPSDNAKLAVEYFGLGRCFDAQGGHAVAKSAYRKSVRFATMAGDGQLKDEVMRELSLLLDSIHDPEAEKFLKETEEFANGASEKAKDKSTDLD